jgi:hypothetical protein
VLEKIKEKRKETASFSVVKSDSSYIAHWIYIYIYMCICTYIVSFVALVLLKLIGNTWNWEILGQSR